MKPTKTSASARSNRSITVDIKRSLMVPANYNLLLGTTLILHTMHLDSVQYVQEAARKGYVVKYLTLRSSYDRAKTYLTPKQFHAFSHVLGTRTKNHCFHLVKQMIEDFYVDLILYSSQTGIPAKDLSTASLHIRQLAYLSHYLTYQLEGKPRTQSPLAVMRAKLAAKREPIQMRIERKRKLGITISSTKPGIISNQYQQPLDFN